MALNKAQVKLLGLLKDKDSEQGVFFARWDEIRAARYPEQWLEGHKDAPNLDWKTERLLLDLIDRDCVEELEKWGTKEGKHFRITSMGLKALDHAESPTYSKVWGGVKKPVAWVALPVIALWLAYLFGPELGIVDFLSNVSSR